jgi:hypothetical protein
MVINRVEKPTFIMLPSFLIYRGQNVTGLSNPFAYFALEVDIKINVTGSQGVESISAVSRRFSIQDTYISYWLLFESIANNPQLRMVISIATSYFEYLKVSDSHFVFCSSNR